MEDRARRACHRAPPGRGALLATLSMNLVKRPPREAFVWQGRAVVGNPPALPLLAAVDRGGGGSLLVILRINLR